MVVTMETQNDGSNNSRARRRKGAPEILNGAEMARGQVEGSKWSSANLVLYAQFVYELCAFYFSIWYGWLQFWVSKFLVVPQPKSLNGEIVLVTGGANGIGREICLKLASSESKNLTLISWDVDQHGNDLLVKELKAIGLSKVYGYQVDVSKREEVEAGAKKIRQQVGDVSILFNNAGIAGKLGRAWEVDPVDVQRVFEINTLAHCWTLREFLPSMIEKGVGHVVETCSVLGFLYGRNGSSYVGSKHALRGYIESVKEDLRSLPNTSNINFTLVYPHNTFTNLTANVNFSAGKYPWMMLGMSPAYVASQIIDGVLRNEEHIYVPGFMRAFDMIQLVLPPRGVRRFTDLLDVQTDT